MQFFRTATSHWIALLWGNEDPTPATRTFTVRFGPSITTVDPPSGPIGTFVTITGTTFEPGTTQVRFNGLAAAVRTLTAMQITTTVPIGVTTGPLVVTTSRGTASRTFTVGTTGDFTLTAAPATARVIAGDQTSVSVQARVGLGERPAGQRRVVTTRHAFTVRTRPTQTISSAAPI